jgi:hypothetical protein
VTGGTFSSDYPTTPDAFDRSYNDNSPFGPDLFVSKLTADGSALLYSTFLGGRSGDGGTGVAVNQSGQAVVIGNTFSRNYPTTRGAFDRSYNGSLDAFVTKLKSDGSALVYSTFLGGRNFDGVSGIRVDRWGQAYVTGETGSQNYPTTRGAFDRSFNDTGAPTPGGDAFISKLKPEGSALVYSTFLGGRNADRGSGIAVNRRGQAYVIGSTFSNTYPTTRGAFDRSYNGFIDAFVTKLNADGTAPVYSTYLGGTDQDAGSGIAVNRRGKAYLTGQTDSEDYPTTPRAFDRSFNGGSRGRADTFVSKLEANGSAILYSTYLGGMASDEAFDIAVNRSGHAFVVGSTSSEDYPTTPRAFDRSFGGSLDAFVSKLDPVPARR